MKNGIDHIKSLSREILVFSTTHTYLSSSSHTSCTRMRCVLLCQNCADVWGRAVEIRCFAFVSDSPGVPHEGCTCGENSQSDSTAANILLRHKTTSNQRVNEDQLRFYLLVRGGVWEVVFFRRWIQQQNWHLKCYFFMIGRTRHILLWTTQKNIDRSGMKNTQTTRKGKGEVGDTGVSYGFLKYFSTPPTPAHCAKGPLMLFRWIIHGPWNAFEVHSLC